MGRRKQRIGGLRRRPKPTTSFASDLPRLRDWVCSYLTELRTEIIDDPDGRYARLKDMPDTPLQAATGLAAQERLASLLDVLASDSGRLAGEDCVLWWVSRSMTRLAYEAREIMPEWSPHAARPARHGVILWDGGAGVGWDWSCDPTRPSPLRGREPDIVGAIWLSDDTGILRVYPVLVGGDGPRGFGVDLTAATIWAGDGTPFGPTHKLWPMLGATWLLAQSPTVGVCYGVRYNRRDPERPFAKPALPGLITQVTLRESLRKGEIQDPDRVTQSRPGPSHQFIVRGHWRQQACGPKRAWRKPVFIAPYVKGPEGTELVTKPTVHVWRR